MPVSEMQHRASLPFHPSAPDGAPHDAAAIPPWVHANTGDGHTPAILPPQDAVIPTTRHDRPPPNHYRPGRKWDHLRTAEPALLSQPIADHQLRWTPFMSSGPEPLERNASARIVGRSWMEDNMPFLYNGWRPDDDVAADEVANKSEGGLMYRGKWLLSPERQEKTLRLFWRPLLRNPLVPAFFRIAVLAFSAAALGIACTIYTSVQHVNIDANPNNQCATRASTYMAIVVGSVAIPYIVYVTRDEYTSKPLGLRSAWAKVLLLLCDLFFIVFTGSNVSLALEALFDRRWACYPDQYQVLNSLDVKVPSTCPNNLDICFKQRALSGVLLVSLIVWMITFSISILRVVEKLRPD